MSAVEQVKKNKKIKRVRFDIETILLQTGRHRKIVTQLIHCQVHSLFFRRQTNRGNAREILTRPVACRNDPIRPRKRTHRVPGVARIGAYFVINTGESPSRDFDTCS